MRRCFPISPPHWRVCHGPGAGGAGGHSRLSRRLPPRSASTRHAPERKSAESQQWGRGGEAASPMLPSLALAVVPGGASPEASLVAGSLRRGGRSGSGQALCCGCVRPYVPSSCGQDSMCCPAESRVGRTLPPAKSPADRCPAAWFFGRRQ